MKTKECLTYYFLITFLILIQESVMAQENIKSYPLIGELVPEFKLKEMYYYSKPTFSSADIKDKWVILDFWSTGCVACVKSFPKLNKLQTEFLDDIQFVLIAKNDRKYNSNVREIYDKYRRKLNLSLPIAYDTLLFEQFGIETVPHVIIVDKSRRVYAVTFSDALTYENLSALVNNKSPKFQTKYNAYESEPRHKESRWKYFVDTKENKQAEFIYRSILSVNNGEPFDGSLNIEKNVVQGIYQVTKANLFRLYNIAFFGESDWGIYSPVLYKTCWKYPILELSDSSLFRYDLNFNTGFYNYSLTVPKEKASRENLMEIMQRDLRNSFGFDVSLVRRKMPYWRLSATKEAIKNLKTRSGTTEVTSGPTGIKGKNVSISTLLNVIYYYNSQELPPFIDETGITGNIDINLDAVMTSLPDVRNELQKNGLDLQRKEKEMTVLVIRNSGF